MLRLSAKEAKMATLPIQDTSVFDQKFRPKPLIRKPIKGKTGTNQTKFIMYAVFTTLIYSIH